MSVIRCYGYVSVDNERLTVAVIITTKLNGSVIVTFLLITVIEWFFVILLGKIKLNSYTQLNEN